MAEDASHVGAAIRRARLAANLTQPRLARQAAVSLSLLGKVECGDRVATHALLAAVSRALKIPVERLTGQPYADNHRDEQTHRAVAALRTVLRHYDLPGDITPRPLAALTSDVESIARMRRNAQYGALAVRLPALVEELTAASQTADVTNAHHVFGLLVTVYHATHTLLHRLGYADLAESVEHHLAQAAHRASDPLAAGLAHWARVQSFQSAGDYAHGLRLMDAARAELDDTLRAPGEAAITVYGSLHLRSVTLASRAGDADTARSHLAAARDLARDLTTDHVHYGLTFGPANITTHEVAAQVELGDGAAALTAARAWSPPRTMPRTRRGHHHLDLARAHLILGDRHGCLDALQQARHIAPQQTRLHPMVRETTSVLISLYRRSHPELSHYADWLGLTA